MLEIVRNCRPVRLLYLAALTGIGASAGCVDKKDVHIVTGPNGFTNGELVFTKIDSKGEAPFKPMPPVSVAPATVQLVFEEKTGTHYRVVAHHVLCSPSSPVDILDNPQTEYTLRLTPYKKYVTALGYAPVKTGDVWQLKPAPAQAVAMLDDKEPSPIYIDAPEKITANISPDIDFPGFTVSPAADVMVYEQVQLNAAQPGTYLSNLFKLPLATGESPTLLTQGDKHQHFPAFDFGGDKIYADSDDNLRTDAPFSFDIGSNEASVDILEHDSNTLEYEFSAGHDCLAFTSYGEYGADSIIQVCSLDGTGPTPRVNGISPQISPDGNRILYAGKPENGSKFRLWTVNARGPKGLRKLGPIDDADCFDPHWSPDGKLVAFCSAKRSLDGSEPAADIDNERDPRFQDPDSQHSFIWVVAADGKHAIRLTRNESFDSHPVWDRNGKTIYFRSNRGGAWNIWKLNLTPAGFSQLGMTPPGQ